MREEDLAAVRASLDATRSTVKALQRMARTAGQLFADLEERVNVLNAQPEEAQRNGSRSHEHITVERVV